jgi:hypothetical protein
VKGVGDGSILRIAGLFSLLSVASIMAAIVIGVSTGGGGPVAIDFGDPEVLQAMAASGRVPVLLSFLALAGPTLGLPAGLGWLRLVGHKGGYVLAGVVLWYLGMVFVIWQDAMELVLVAELPQAYAAADGAQAEALLAAGRLLGAAVETFIVLGDVVSFFGMLLVNVAMWALGGRWRILATAGAAACVLITAGVAFPALAPARLPGFVLFVAWMAATGLVMLRGTSAGAEPAAQ